MYTEEILLKYLDDELTAEECKSLEQRLAVDASLRARLEEVKEKRMHVLTALDSLNPKTVSEVPPFKAPVRNPARSSNLIRYAAAAVVLIGVVITLWLVTTPSDKKDHAEVVTPIYAVETTYEDLDCFISPNRCWNERKIPLITIKIQ
jgi:anti-sigma factor RsiW